MGQRYGKNEGKARILAISKAQAPAALKSAKGTMVKGNT
jgi:hypothetical protein